MYILAYLKCGAHHKSALWVLSSSELPQKCQNSSETSKNVSVQLEMTHIHSSLTNISLWYTSVLPLSIYRCTVGF